MINSPDGFFGRPTSGGPEGFNCFGVVEKEIPAGLTVDVSTAKQECDVRVEVQRCRQRGLRQVIAEPEELSSSILE